MRKYFLTLILIVSHQNASGAINTGEQLLKNCDSYISYMGNKKIPDSNFAHDMGICIGFIDGVIYTHSVTRTGSPIWCLPNNVTSDQVIRVLVNHLRENPDDQKKNIGTVVLVAMVNAFPCPG